MTRPDLSASAAPATRTADRFSLAESSSDRRARPGVADGASLRRRSTRRCVARASRAVERPQLTVRHETRRGRAENARRSNAAPSSPLTCARTHRPRRHANQGLPTRNRSGRSRAARWAGVERRHQPAPDPAGTRSPADHQTRNPFICFTTMILTTPQSHPSQDPVDGRRCPASRCDPGPSRRGRAHGPAKTSGPPEVAGGGGSHASDPASVA